MLHDNIKKDYFAAMKNNDKQTKAVLSMVIPRLDSMAKEQKVTLVSDNDAQKAIRAEVKQINQSIEGAKQAGRPDQEDKYMRDLIILEDYLPVQATDEEIDSVVKSVLITMGDQNFGVILREASTRLGSAADNGRISQSIKKLK